MKELIAAEPLPKVQLKGRETWEQLYGLQVLLAAS
jgi:hypothetical protein